MAAAVAEEERPLSTREVVIADLNSSLESHFAINQITNVSHTQEFNTHFHFDPNGRVAQRTKDVINYISEFEEMSIENPIRMIAASRILLRINSATSQGAAVNVLENALSKMLSGRYTIDNVILSLCILEVVVLDAFTRGSTVAAVAQYVECLLAYFQNNGVDNFIRRTGGWEQLANLTPQIRQRSDSTGWQLLKYAWLILCVAIGMAFGSQLFDAFATRR